MPSIGDWIRQLLPDGSRYSASKRSWARCPPWPPDAFAVAATLTANGGCYAHSGFTAHFEGKRGFFNARFRASVIDDGRTWASGHLPERVQEAWSQLWGSRRQAVRAAPAKSWHRAALYLIAAADEACRGMGFVDDSLGAKSRPTLQNWSLDAYREWLIQRPTRLPYVPMSMCISVPPDAACVQPKAITPQVGCTIRSLTHHLALVPNHGEVQSAWFVDPAMEARRESLNFLLVPFPYAMDAECFQAVGRRCPGNADFFALEQRWLRHSGRRISPDALHRFVKQLIAEAGTTVHAVAFPELSLDATLARELATRLVRDTDLEFFIAGISTPPPRRGALPRNEVFTALRRPPAIHFWAQSKHHRWRLDTGQIHTYDLQRLDSRQFYWENIDISERTAVFWPVRHGAVAGALICEDLARVDPVQPLFRSVGPNIVIALLMDGPQLERRWPGRFATSLADDPGSAVLTINSVALLRRSERANPSAHKIALWKQPNASARELELDRGAHALLIKLRYSEEENWTLDGRGDNHGTVRFLFEEARSIRHRAPPPWAVHI